jgi:hypothetical protein
VALWENEARRGERAAGGRQAVIGDKAIRFGEKLPAHHTKMVKVMCGFSFGERGYCGAIFRIIHEEKTADLARAKKQFIQLLTILRGEHSQNADSKVHKKVYNLDI